MSIMLLSKVIRHVLHMFAHAKRPTQILLGTEALGAAALQTAGRPRNGGRILQLMAQLTKATGRYMFWSILPRPFLF